MIAFISAHGITNCARRENEVDIMVVPPYLLLWANAVAMSNISAVLFSIIIFLKNLNGQDAVLISKMQYAKILSWVDHVPETVSS